MEMSGRRNFLLAGLGAIFTLATGAVFYPIYRYLAPRQDSGKTRKASFGESSVLPGEAKFFDYQGATAVIVRKSSGDLVALSAVCTHLGCIVQWQKDRQDFLCPCHAGRYTVDGIVIGGPPPRPLPKLPFTVANGIITVG